MRRLHALQILHDISGVWAVYTPLQIFFRHSEGLRASRPGVILAFFPPSYTSHWCQTQEVIFSLWCISCFLSSVLRITFF